MTEGHSDHLQEICPLHTITANEFNNLKKKLRVYGFQFSVISGIHKSNIYYTAKNICSLRSHLFFKDEKIKCIVCAVKEAATKCHI